MTLYSILVIYLLLYCVPISKCTVSKTDFETKDSCICVKEGDTRSIKHPIKITATSFKDLVRHSKVFVDKSLLVKLILEKESTVVSMTYPKKWGKSINLDMLRRFLEIEVDRTGKRIPLKNTWGYRFFKKGEILLDKGKAQNLKSPPLISQHTEITKEHLGQHPVVYLDLSTLQHNKMANYEEFMQAFREIISKLYEKHDYMINVYQDTILNNSTLDSEKIKAGVNIETFQKHLTRRKLDSNKETAKSLEFLCEILYAHFNQRVYLLIDGYDAMVQVAYFDTFHHFEPQEAKKIYDFSINFLTKSLETNKYMRNGIITGTFSLGFGHSHSVLNYLTNFNMLSKYKNLFYGFTETEVNQLFAHLKLPEKTIHEAHEWYGGYKLSVYPNASVFNPWSVANFLNEKKIQNYWGRTGLLNLFPNMKHYTDKKNIFMTLINEGAEVKMHRSYLTLSLEDVELMKKLVNSDERLKLDDATETLLLIYYYANGYLTLSSEPQLTSWTEIVPLKIPNKEIWTEIMDEFKIYHSRKFGNRWITLAERISSALSTFIQTRGNLTYPKSHLKNDLKAFYQPMFENYDDVHCAHRLISLYLKSHLNISMHISASYPGYSNFSFSSRSTFISPYKFSLLLHKEQEGFVIEFQYSDFEYWKNSKDFEDSMENFKKKPAYKKFFKSRGSENVHYMRIGFNEYDIEDGLFIATDTCKFDPKD